MSAIRKILLLCVFAPALSISPSFAVEPGFYIGASGGQTSVDMDASDFGIDRDSNFNIDEDDTGWKAYLGYNFTSWLGVETGYVDFGGASDQFRGTNYDLDVTGWDGFLVGTLPLGPVDLFAKAGAIDLQADLNYGNSKENDDDQQFAYGVGMAYNIGHWGLRVEAEGFDDNEVDDFYFLSAGITYHFFRDKEEPVAAAEPAPAPVEACPDGDRDGVCDADDVCPDTAAGARVDAIGCNCAYSLLLEFAFDSAELTASDTAQLDRIVPVLRNPRAGSMRGTVIGHTDSVGSEAYNQKLSERRAQSVMDYLESQGVNISNFTARGYGESQPVASNDTDEGRARNRRVEVQRTDCGS